MPIRTCVGCRLRLEQAALVRIRSSGDELVVGHGDGRGVWVGPSPACLALAVKRRGIARGLRIAADADRLARLAESWPSESVACPHAEL